MKRISLIDILILLFSLFAVSMIFLPLLTINNPKVTLTGFHIIFGAKIIVMGAIRYLSILPSLMNAVILILPLFSALAVVIHKKGFYISLFISLASFILLFFIPLFTKIDAMSSAIMDFKFSYNFGLYLALISNGLVIVLSVLKSFKKN